PTADDYSALIRALKRNKPKVVLELGTAHGNTVANICRELPDCKVYTVNALLEDQTGGITTFGLTKDEIGRVYREYGYGSRVVQIYENTLKMDLSRYLHRGQVDFAIIDACHDPDFVINDFLKITPFLKENALVFFHDTHPSMKKHLWGSYSACVRLRFKGYDIRHLKGTWWGVWRFNSYLFARKCKMQLREFVLKIFFLRNAILLKMMRRIEDINCFEMSVFSQNGEDGILDAIFKKIGTTNNYYVEFGVEDGSQCNTRFLRERRDWKGLMMDGGDCNTPFIKKEFITAENVNSLFEKYKVPDEFDLLSIDIDGNDYWVWKALDKHYRPRVMV
ncbi:MAG: class I SAM-dependent methyltransferase, partial [Nitrosotalea sp.]